MRRNKSELQELHERVQRVIFDLWDPIGFGDEGVPKDEYDAYVRPICSMIVTTAESTLGDFVDPLVKAEQRITGMPVDLKRIYRTAEKLVEMRRIQQQEAMG